MKILIITNSHRIDDVRLYGKIGLTISSKHNVVILGFKGEELVGKDIVTIKLPNQEVIDNLFELKRNGLTHNPDIVICVEPLTLLVGRAIQKRTGCALVYDCHEYFGEAFSERYKGVLKFFSTKAYHLIENYLLKTVDLIITVNDLIKHRYKKLKLKTIVLPNYPVKSSNKRVTSKLYDLIYVGGVTKDRGVFKILGATEKLKSIFPAIKVLILGRISHDLKLELYKAVLTKNLEENFILMGEVDPKTVKEYISQSKIGISLFNPNLQRYTKALPLKTLEYLEYGLPVITNDFKFLRENFPKEFEALNYIEYNTHSLVVTTQKLLTMDTTKLDRIKKQCHKFIEDNANWSLNESLLLNEINVVKPSVRVLYCAYFYPPLGGPAVQRPCKTIKYMNSKGWECDVLSVKDIYYHSIDETLNKECTEKNRFLTSSFDPMYLVKKVKKKNPSRKSFYFNLPESTKIGAKKFFPIDDKIGWLIPAVMKGLNVSRSKRYKYIFATMGPYTTGLVGFIISKFRKIPFVLDYRDHWTINPYDDNLKILKRLSVFWEAKLLDHAHHVTVVSQIMKDQICSKFGFDLREKISVLYNGWDESDFIDIKKTADKDSIILSYVGNFYRNRTPKYFIDAICELKLEQLLPSNLKIRFVGNYFKEAKEQIERSDFVEIAEIFPQVTHSEAINLLFESDGLLLFIASENGTGVLSGKLFEYMRTQKPILAMVPEYGEAAEILKYHGHNNICNMEDVDKIKAKIKSFLSEIYEKQADYKIPHGYSREEQTKRLVKLLSDKE